MTKDSYNSKKIYSNVKIIKLDPLAESLDSIGLKGGAGKSVSVIRGTSKRQDVSSAPGNKLNDKYQGRYFFERAKTKKADTGRVDAAKSFARSNTDVNSKWGVKPVSAKDRLILKTTLTPREARVGRRLFERFAPPLTPFSYPSQRQGRLGRIIVPRSALKRQKVDRKLTREVRKEND
jgi:hypothetical protein